MTRGLLLLVLAAAASCGEAPVDVGAAADARPAPSPDAFCVEHGVAEAVCTKCNPALTPIFKDNGDWCEPHGFPESFCPTCYPERGGRPDVELGAGPPATGLKVQLASPLAAQQAGIETVEARSAENAPALEVVGTIAYDAARRAEINARARGVVREILVEVGQQVAANDPLVRIESAEIGAEQSKLLAASARIAVARAALERVQALFERGMAAQKDLLEAQLEVDTALAERAAAEAALGIVGVDAQGGSSFVLVAPLAGTCVRREATIGRMVDAGEVLLEIVDTSTMWAELDVPERALASVLPGQPVVITADALGRAEFTGTIEFIAPEIDRHTRTAKARVRLENPGGVLRANLFVRARISLGPKHSSVLVPRSALQRAKGVELVFVELEPGSYETRRVRSLDAYGDLVALADGVSAGERVVSAGSFLLKTETLKGEIGAGCCAEE
jgi:cobalt-zinc-cadmium efflux system membrane fusion protein